ncbi:hypothetical protein, partial [Kutzneria sp. 744]|uniref:hypothetical protein n=1 Tax=Kutzneria sp. (strain 744) TaxID=345341 RepID=UPI001E2A02E8
LTNQLHRHDDQPLVEHLHRLLAALTCLRRAEAGDPATATAPDGSTGTDAVVGYWRRCVTHAAHSLVAHITAPEDTLTRSA